MSREQQRLRLRSAMKLLMEGEDFDYIKMQIHGKFPASLNQRELKEIALNIAVLPNDDRDALIRDISPNRFDERHFRAAMLEKQERAEGAAKKAQRQQVKLDQRAAEIERAKAARRNVKLQWQLRFQKIKFWSKVIFWSCAAITIFYVVFLY